ncbi:MAG: hypothetical protein KKB88_01230 [Nanoarchaeota archaeon]|nr:hypothetical protein [Nanoarchaeota archaeon]
MDRDKVKVILKDAISKAFEDLELDDRVFLIGDKTINLMSESALNVLLAVEDIQDYLKREGELK